jgi:hypothetical protein
MCQSIDAVDAVPLPAVALTLKPDAEPQIRGVRLDLDGTVLGCQQPQVTVTVVDLELRDPKKIAPCFWKERHCPLRSSAEK